MKILLSAILLFSVLTKTEFYKGFDSIGAGGEFVGWYADFAADEITRHISSEVLTLGRDKSTVASGFALQTEEQQAGTNGDPRQVEQSFDTFFQNCTVGTPNPARPTEDVYLQVQLNLLIKVQAVLQ